MTKLTDISVFLQDKHIKPLSMTNLTDVSLFFRSEVMLLIMREKSFCILKLFVWKSYIYKTLYLYFWCYQTLRFAESRYQHDWNTGFTLNYSSKLQLQLQGRTGTVCQLRWGGGGLGKKEGVVFLNGRLIPHTICLLQLFVSQVVMSVFEINLFFSTMAFQSSHFSTWPKSQDKNFNIFKTKWAYKKYFSSL